MSAGVGGQGGNFPSLLTQSGYIITFLLFFYLIFSAYNRHVGGKNPRLLFLILSQRLFKLSHFAGKKGDALKLHSSVLASLSMLKARIFYSKYGGASPFARTHRLLRPLFWRERPVYASMSLVTTAAAATAVDGATDIRPALLLLILLLMLLKLLTPPFTRFLSELHSIPLPLNALIDTINLAYKKAPKLLLARSQIYSRDISGVLQIYERIKTTRIFIAFLNLLGFMSLWHYQYSLFFKCYPFKHVHLHHTRNRNISALTYRHH